jgi:quinol monooxygenase YgiN
MIIVAGALRVDPAQRTAYLAGCSEVIARARRAEGCLDFHLSPDPIEPDRINVFELWESVEAVEDFRGSGPSGAQQDALRSANVWQHEIGLSTRL